MKFYPSRIQWIVLWGISLVALWMWIDGSTPWEAHDRRIVALVVVGALVLWMVSDLDQLREVVDWYGREEKRKAQMIALGIGLALVFAALMGWFEPDPARVSLSPAKTGTKKYLPSPPAGTKKFSDSYNPYDHMTPDAPSSPR